MVTEVEEMTTEEEMIAEIEEETIAEIEEGMIAETEREEEAALTKR